MKHLFTIAILLMTLQMAKAVYTEDVATNFVNQGQLVSATNGLATTNYVVAATASIGGTYWWFMSAGTNVIVSTISPNDGNGHLYLVDCVESTQGFFGATPTSSIEVDYVDTSGNAATNLFFPAGSTNSVITATSTWTNYIFPSEMIAVYPNSTISILARVTYGVQTTHIAGWIKLISN